MGTHLPYSADYAKSNVSRCRWCRRIIEKDALRMSVSVTCWKYDGRQDNWYHFPCFWRALDGEINEPSIRGVEFLRWKDQERVRQRIAAYNRCEALLAKAVKFGLIEEKVTTHHPLSVMQERANEDRKPEPKKPKLDLHGSEFKLKEQTDTFWYIKDAIRTHMKSKKVNDVLKEMGRFFPKPAMDRLDELADCVLFGVPTACAQCQGALEYNSVHHSYKCRGNTAMLCTAITRNPPRSHPPLLDEVKAFLTPFDLSAFTQRLYPEVFDEDPVRLDCKKDYLDPDGDYGGLSGRVIVKRCLSVDIAGLCSEETHVYKGSPTAVWQATLILVDLQAGRNSFYKIQLLKHDERDKYFILRQWGRIGIEQGDTRWYSYGRLLDDAKKDFRALFKAKTDNEWENRDAFIHRRGKYFLMKEQTTKLGLTEGDLHQPTCSLSRAVQEALFLMFDREMLANAVKELSVDLKRLPLGKVCLGQLRDAEELLNDLIKVLTSESKMTHQHFLERSNYFYTLLPQYAERNPLQILDNIEAITTKKELIADLQEKEYAFDSLVSSWDDCKIKNPVERHYRQLRCTLEEVARDSEEFEVVEKYARNSHAPTHDAYTLRVIDVIRVEQEGESETFASDLPNRYLLWHGSPLYNIAGILRHGLRIAPHDAPSTGAMFGKGLYFAESVSKSANYCFDKNDGSPSNERLLCLFEVALGQMQEETGERYIEWPGYGFDSIKGVGRWSPDPQENHRMLNGVIVPLGKLVPQPVTGKLEHNEYIVYRPSQVRMRYLVRVDFLFSTGSEA